jgi:hypothetical protein
MQQGPEPKDAVALEKFVEGLQIEPRHFAATERRQYLGALDIDVVAAPLGAAGLDAAAASRPRAFRCGRGILCCAPGIARQKLVDTLNSQLMAQVNAGREYDPAAQTRNWHAVYRQQLRKLGWGTDDYDFAKRPLEAETSPLEAALEVVKAFCSAEEYDLVERSARAALVDDGDARTTKLGIVFIGPVYANWYGGITMCLFCFYSETVQGERMFGYNAQRITLDEAKYAPLRAGVEAKLRDFVDKLLEELEL